MDTPMIKSFDQICREEFGKDFGSTEAMYAFQYGTGDAGMQKAMASQDLSGVAGNTMGDYTALRLEDLDTVMTAVLWKMENLKLQRWIKRTPAKQLFWEYDVQGAYGSSRGSTGFVEGGGPSGGIATYGRRQAKIMFKGRRGGVTHQVGVMKGGMLLDPTATENQNRTMELLEILERETTFGQASMKSVDGIVINYDGLYYQILNGTKDPVSGATYETTPKENIIDLRGNAINLNVFEDIARILADARFVTDFSNVKAFMGGTVKADLAKLLRIAANGDPLQRIDITANVPTGGYNAGTPTNGFNAQFGFIPFEHSTFLEPCPGKMPIDILSQEPRSPYNAPTALTGSAGTDATSKVQAGTYYYFVATLNEDNETLPSVASSGITVATSNTHAVTVTITRATADTTRLRGYRIYRGTSNVALDARWIADVADPRSGGSTFTYVDKNQVMPGTDICLVLEGSIDNLVIAQLAPLMRMALPQELTTFPFLLLLYHTLVIRAPKRQFLIMNIGKLG